MKKILISLVGVSLVATSALAEGARDRAETVVPERWRNTYDEWHFAPAVKIDGRIYVSGVVARPVNGNHEEAYRRAWQNIGGILHAAGASLDDVVEIVSYHTDLRAQLPLFGTIKDEFIRKPYPAWTAVGVTQLAVADGVVEIRVIAHAGGLHPLAE